MNVLPIAAVLMVLGVAPAFAAKGIVRKSGHNTLAITLKAGIR